MTNKKATATASATTTAKARCGGLSTPQRTMKLSAAPVEMTLLWLALRVLRGLDGFGWSGGEGDLDGLRARAGVGRGEAYGAGLLLCADPDGSGSSDEGERIVAD